MIVQFSKNLFFSVRMAHNSLNYPSKGVFQSSIKSFRMISNKGRSGGADVSSDTKVLLDDLLSNGILGCAQPV